MYIITDKENVIIKISETKDYQENGNILVDNGAMAIAKILVKDIYEMNEIEEGVEEGKYCYTAEKGFYVNEKYVEYYSTDDRISAIEDVINMILLQ